MSSFPGSVPAGRVPGEVPSPGAPRRKPTGTGWFALLWFGVPLALVLIAQWLDLPDRAARWLSGLFG